MTDTNLEEKERQQFEAWCAKELELPDGYELNFGNDTVRLLSRGWFARAALAQQKEEGLP